MEDQVPFKVYAFWREGSKPEVRRFGVDRNVVSSYTYLLAKIHDVFPKLKEKAFSVSWKDDEGDDVKISSDEEVMTMLTAVPTQLFKLYVHVENKNEEADPHVIKVAFSTPHIRNAHHTPESTPFVFTGHPGLHTGVQCDGCNRGVVGFRYKCITCEDFDLCSGCEAQGVHSEHCFVRIPSPQMSLAVVKDSIKKSRYFLKTFAASLHEAQKKQRAEMKKTGATSSTSGCPMAGVAIPHCSAKLEAKLASKERREERREERQEKRQERNEKRHERREEERRERRENPHERVGWMDIFSKYVDQFANLAADHIRVAAGDAAEQTAQTGDEAPNPLDPAEFAKMMSACMNLRESGCPMAEMFGQESDSQDPQDSGTDKSASAPATQTAAPTAPQDPAQALITPLVPTQAQATPQAPTQASTTPQALPQAPITSQAPTIASATSQVAPNPVKTAEDPKPDNKTDASSMSSAEETSRDTTPDKSAEDWTMINNEKDMEGESGAVQIDSSLPEEFQPRPGGAYGFIYPPLNAATAVYNSQEPVVTPAMTEPAPAATAAPSVQQAQYVKPNLAQFIRQTAQTGQPGHGLSGQANGGPGQAGQARAGQASPPAAAAAPSAPAAEQRQHRVPHIDAAIRQMIAMGFTNEGGWLTQLVESKDGNIAAVLDLLTPVKPNK